MKILFCHTHYQQTGGEDQVFADERRLLETRGHEVVAYTLHNDAIANMNPLGVALRTVWSRTAARELRTLIRQTRPDVMHCTNLFPLISPAAYYAARAEGVPVVQSLHNYRWLCAGAMFLRDGKVCEDCLGKAVPWPALVHRCYRGSLAGTAAVAAMQTVHRTLRTFRRTVDVFVALSEFSRQKFIAGGFPAERLVVKPNFVDPVPVPGAGVGGYALFVGRLSGEKGLDVLLKAWQGQSDLPPLWIVGDGPLAPQVAAAAEQNPSIRWLGRQANDEVLELMRHAVCVVLPSTTYENCPKTILEAYACGTPVVAAHLGAMAEMVDDGVTGLTFQPQDAADLADKVRALLATPAAASRMRATARARFLERYTADVNEQQLLAIYQQALARRPAATTTTTKTTAAAAAINDSTPTVSRDPGIYAPPERSQRVTASASSSHLG